MKGRGKEEARGQGGAGPSRTDSSQSTAGTGAVEEVPALRVEVALKQGGHGEELWWTVCVGPYNGGSRVQVERNVEDLFRLIRMITESGRHAPSIKIEEFEGAARNALPDVKTKTLRRYVQKIVRREDLLTVPAVRDFLGIGASGGRGHIANAPARGDPRNGPSPRACGGRQDHPTSAPTLPTPAVHSPIAARSSTQGADSRGFPPPQTPPRTAFAPDVRAAYPTSPGCRGMPGPDAPQPFVVDAFRAGRFSVTLMEPYPPAPRLFADRTPPCPEDPAPSPQPPPGSGPSLETLNAAVADIVGTRQGENPAADAATERLVRCLAEGHLSRAALPRA